MVPAALTLPSSVLSGTLHTSLPNLRIFLVLVFCHCSPVKCVLLRGDYISVRITQIRNLAYSILTDGMLHWNTAKSGRNHWLLCLLFFVHLFMDHSFTIYTEAHSMPGTDIDDRGTEMNSNRQKNWKAPRNFYSKFFWMCKKRWVPSHLIQWKL